MSNKILVTIDFGQQNPEFADQRLVDENGKFIKFNSKIDPLNYMGKYGWEFKAAYALAVGNQNVQHYLLRTKPEYLIGEFRTKAKKKGAIQNVAKSVSW